MGFELLLIEDGDKDRYEVFTITSPDKWNPQQSLVEASPDSTPYGSTNEDFKLSEEHVVMTKHMFQTSLDLCADAMSKVVGPYNRMMDTHVLAEHLHTKRAYFKI